MTEIAWTARWAAGRRGSGWGCAADGGRGSPPHAPNPTRLLDERRAIEIILTAFRAETTKAHG
jgi:hypothetical protein